MSGPTPDGSEAGSNTPPRNKAVPPSLFQIALVIAWLALLAFSVWFSTQRLFLFAGIGGVISISAIPFVAADSRKKRITAILVMPFIGAGLVGGVVIFFALMNFSWFAAVFNKASGPLGVLLFAFSFSFAGAVAGYRCVALARRWLGRQ
jgi:hypothetical protein